VLSAMSVFGVSSELHALKLGMRISPAHVCQWMIEPGDERSAKWCIHQHKEEGGPLNQTSVLDIARKVQQRAALEGVELNLRDTLEEDLQALRAFKNSVEKEE